MKSGADDIFLLKKYTNNTCEEEPGLKYGDETTKIIINTTGREEGIAQGREEMIQFIIKDNISEGQTVEQIIEKLVKNYELDEAKAREYY